MLGLLIVLQVATLVFVPIGLIWGADAVWEGWWVFVDSPPLVLVGYSDEAGVFYLLPEDVPGGGGKRSTPELLRASISSNDLTAWLRGMDAGELVMIVDACHAVAAVEGTDFKPGPWGAGGWASSPSTSRCALAV